MRRDLAPFSHWIAAERGENSKALRLRLAGHDAGLRAVAIIRGAIGSLEALTTIPGGVQFPGAPSHFFIPNF
jgi:hypothetical protein